ncbi:MAG: restriction endonuclease subunit S [Firmicutes bacterium]|nr:restriction endonuclease subunit S [Bacillota bacterium]
MDTKALRQKILDLAIRGKLVPQDPNDEPASVLLEKIRAEKQQMVKDGKLKAKDIKNDTIIFKGEDNCHYEKFPDGSVKCIDDEIPFELPNGWAWCNLSMIGQTNIGLTYHPTDIVTNGTMVLRSSNIVNGKLDFNDLVRVNTNIRESQYVKINDILICARNGSKSLVGKCAIIKDISEKASFGAFMAIYRTVFYEYVYYFLNTNLFREVFYDGNSTTINQLTQAMIKSARIPLPPYSEQCRIVKKLHFLLTFLDKVESNKNEIQVSIQVMKSKILDLAIRGKLVPQDPNDEPASVLLEKIRAEKENLIKEGKIKRDKRESVIYKGDDNSYYEKIGDEIKDISAEIPFDLPQGWEWTRLNNVCSILTDGTHKTPNYTDKGFIFLSSRNITSGKIDWENVMYIPENLHNELYSRLSPNINDILLAKNGTTGVVALVDKEYIFDIYVSLALIRILNGIILPKYVIFAIRSSFVQNYFNSSLKGIGVPNLHLEHIRNTLIPIPPYGMQEKIVEKLDKYFETIESIEKSLI